YGFKPTDLVVGRDGALFVSDWADGQRPKRGRGRIYRIVPTDGAKRVKPAAKERSIADWIAQLDSESYHQRVDAQQAIERLGPKALPVLAAALDKGKLGVLARLHAVWIMAHSGAPSSRAELADLARTDADVRVRAQAVRALADLVDPVLVAHRLDAPYSPEKV